MALKLTDRVVETTQTTGTGVIDLLGAQTGFRTFGADLTSGDTTPYVIVDDPNAPNAYEYGIGTWTAGSPNTLARTTIQGSSNGGNAISLQSGQTYVVTGSPIASVLLTTQDKQSSPTDMTADRLLVTDAIASEAEHNSPSGVEKLARLDRLLSSRFGYAAAGRISGIVPSNGTDADHDIDFTSGVSFSLDGTIGVSLPALTKQGDAPFAKGTNAGAAGTGVSLPTSGTVHWFAIREDATGDGDIYMDTSVSAANIPSGWTLVRRVFSITTTGASVISWFNAWEMAGGSLLVKRISSTPDLNISNQGTGFNTVTLNSLPSGIDVPVDLGVRSGRAGESSVAVLIMPPSSNNLSASRVNARSSSGGSAVNSANYHANEQSVVAENQKVKITADGADTVVTITVKGWTDRRAA